MSIWRDPVRSRCPLADLTPSPVGDAAFRFGVALCFVFALSSIPARGQSPPVAPRPNVILIVVDTLRADRVDGFGGKRGLTPYLRYLQVQGVTFRSAYAASSWTRPSVASLFTSRYPSQHLVNSTDSVLSEKETTLAEVLASNGYSNIGYSANPNVAPNTGYGQGFVTFKFVAAKRLKTRGPRLRAAALAEIDRSCRPPCLLYFQFMEPHAPYRAPHKRRVAYGRNRSIEQQHGELSCEPSAKLAQVLLESLDYDAEVAAADDEMRILFGELEQRGLLENSIIIFTSDHGEEFLDHGMTSHGTSLYEELVRVPLIIVAPGVQGFRVIDENVSLVDLAPTLLELLDLPAEKGFEGRSLVPFLRGGGLGPGQASRVGARSAREVIFELLGGWPLRLLQRHQAGIIGDTLKTLEGRNGGSFASYDLRLDKGEISPLPSADQGQIEDLGALRGELAGRALAAPEHREISPETKERLRQLGYDF